ncbi:hypothetical protein, partial [uncultured Nocardioides sp.]|uniref:hypothetical protein n=1 Tax=uncultured Nocardioides sp. TaxID=198441 RepID=UPI00261F8768
MPPSLSQPPSVVPLPRPHDGAVTLPGHGRTLLRQVRRVQEESARRGRTAASPLARRPPPKKKVGD